LAAVSGVMVEHRHEQYRERSGRRSPPPYNSPRSRRARVQRLRECGNSVQARIYLFKTGAWIQLCFLMDVNWDFSRFGWDVGEEDDAIPERGGRGTEEVAERRSQAHNGSPRDCALIQP